MFRTPDRFILTPGIAIAVERPLPDGSRATAHPLIGM